MNFNALFWAFKHTWKMGKKWIVTSLVFSVLLGMLPIALIYLTKELVNSIANLINSGGSYKIPLLFLSAQFGIMVFDSLLRHYKGYIDQKIIIKMEHQLSLNIVEKLDRMSYVNFDEPTFYNHLERIKDNSGSKFLSPINSLLSLLESLISITGLLGFLFTIHWSLGVLSFVILVPVFFVKSFYGNKQFWLNYHLAPVAREASYIKRLLMDRQYVKEVKVFNLYQHFIERWSDRFLLNANRTLSLFKSSKKADISLDGISALFYVIAAGIIIWLTRQSLVRIGDFVAIGQAVQSTQSAVENISANLASIYADNLYINDYFHFMNFEENSSENRVTLFPEHLSKGIKFENVSFKYPGSDEETLKDISLTIRTGEKIAIVGHNGSGKTSLIKCLLGLYPVTKGKILYDDLNINLIKQDSLYENITVIFQDFIKYNFTVKENIVFSDIKEFNNYPKLIEAAIKSGLHNEILKLPNGYDTNLGKYLNEGIDLSGGQWQRLAISRALFKDSQLIVLDEPTSALDPVAEMEFLEYYNKISDNKTAIFISHRMSIGKMVDRIIVLNDGKIIESGTHDELISQQGEYSKLYNAQSELLYS